ncbi:MAG TPA: NUDIX hydrolase [Terrimicrobiaceae bacterium]|nr:NUDIX hydrolase [Terrimicrobiaceae bacterium]
MSGGQSPGWSTLQSEALYASPHLQVFHERIATPSRPEGVDWQVVRRRTAAVVAPRTPDGRFLLLRQERAAVRRTLWEFPAGQVDGDGGPDAEPVRAAAERELGEEAGVRCEGGWISLGGFYSSVGFTDEFCHLFLARDVVPRPDGPSHDAQEAILEVRAFTPSELEDLIASGEIVDANTLAAYARMRAKGVFS